MILFSIILIISFSFERYDCLRNDFSSAFTYGQESLPKSLIVRRSVHKKNCKGDLTCFNGGKCENDHCQCTEHFMGHDCNIARCGNIWCSQTGGKCKNKKQCQCSLRYGGPDCSGVKCSKGTLPGLICFNGGTCNNESEICNCRAGYQDQGSGCLLKVCPNGDLCYSNHGICTPAGCKCRSNTTRGSDCSRSICGKSGLICHNGGTCTDDKHCQCLYGWAGVTCNGRKCPGFTNLVCYSATCPAPGSAPVCQCPGHAKGKDCSGYSCGNKGLACFNGGTCDEASATCSCLAGFGGSDCRAVQCAGHPNLYCYNGGCPPVGSDAQCICSDPYTGHDCSQAVCSHSAITCYNGGECTDGQTCTCPPGYGGINCRGLPCGSGFCYNDGECVTDATSGEMKCMCPHNYTLPDCSGRKCSENGLICHNGATCERDEHGNYTCQCTGQWASADCSATPCLQALCYNGGYCDEDGKGKDGCVCLDGWLGADCRAQSCGPNGPICHNGGKCIRADNSNFTCQCEHPWFGPTCEEQKCGASGLICLNSGTCGLSPIDHTSHVCTCSAGFTGDDCSAVVCGTDGNACYNDGYCNETTSTCVCPPPLTSEDCRGNICGAGTANSIVCQNDGVCVENADAEWTCNCTRSWTGPYCMLHVCGGGDDSSSNLLCAHEGICTHSSTTGTFTCSCPSQWTGVDCSGMRCTEPEITCYNQADFDTDVCTAKGCDCLNDGYGADCRGVRCGLDPGRCYNGATCIDSYHGICSPCPPGVTGRDCSMTICPGVKSGHCFNGGYCLGGTTCLCGLRSEWSGVDCSERNCSGGYKCLNGGLCNKNSTSRTCICPPDYEGSKCETSIKTKLFL